jgi:NADH-quinone oxidoreductase subunit J
VGERIVFGVAAVSALVSAVLVITLRSPFRATISLIGTLVSIAVLFLLMAAPFVAVIQVIVYAGAIVVLFLFVIAYLGERPVAAVGDRLGRYQVFAWIAVAGLAVQATVVLATTRLPGVRDDPAPVDDIGSPEAIGRSFIDDYIVPFEATSLALLVAAVGAVILAKRAIRSEGGR